jgi:hypothetical protein
MKEKGRHMKSGSGLMRSYRKFIIDAKIEQLSWKDSKMD